MSTGVGFSVIYRFRVKPDREEAFRDGWRRLTIAIREHRGGLGSRLHRAEDGLWIAYAQWPSRAAWEQSRTMESADEQAGQLMADSIVESLPPILLEPVIDLLEPGR